jgi:hypothetical protein
MLLQYSRDVSGLSSRHSQVLWTVIGEINLFPILPISALAICGALLTLRTPRLYAPCYHLATRLVIDSRTSVAIACVLNGFT